MNNNSIVNPFKELCNVCNLPFRKISNHMKIIRNSFYDILDITYKYEKNLLVCNLILIPLTQN